MTFVPAGHRGRLRAAAAMLLLGVNKQGDITYTVVIIPDEFNDQLRWNMTAAVTIQTE